MIKKLTRGAIIALTAVMLLLPFNKVNAGIPVGTWRSHPSYNNATLSVKAFGRIFVLSDGALYFYDPDDDAVYTIDKTGGLSDTDIASMAYCNSEKAIVLVYSNGNIDILYDDETIYNFTDLKNNSIASVSINEVKIVDGDKAYIATNIGLVIFDLKRREIKSTYRFDKPVRTSVLKGDSLFCSTDAGLYLGLTSDNLLDKSNWAFFLDLVFNGLYSFDGNIWGLYIDNSCWKIDCSTKDFFLVKDNVNSIYPLSDERLALIQDSTVILYESETEFTQLSFDDRILHILDDGDNYWISQGINGLGLYTVSDDVITCKARGIKPNSPRSNLFHYVTWPERERLLAVSGCQNYQEINYPGTVMIYENDRWSYLQEDLSETTGVDYINLTEVAQDPDDSKHIFVGSAGQGLYEFYDGKFIKLHTWNNSALRSIINNTEYNRNNFVRISALSYDKLGNLWMANNEVDTVIKVLQPDGKWFGLYYNEIAGFPTLKQMKFDHNGYVWINSSRHSPGLICIDPKSTVKDNSDDIIRFSGSNFKNQDGITEEVYDIYFYDFDFDGNIWIGTNTGIFILRDPDNFINNPNPVFERIKIKMDENPDYASYLFNGVMTTAIYIDQGNRKWIGTLNDGVFLLSADGTQTLEHFTTKNSPLPSNNILSITENGLNGSLFFCTSQGMVEYGGQARDSEKTLSESNILVYPNPVKPDFDGYVTITGLTQSSTIRILSNSGRLIHYGTSNGGSYSWNITDMNGRPVPSGVYHAVITDQENKNSESVSITVIR